MRRFVLLTIVLLLLAPPLGCSDLGPPIGSPPDAGLGQFEDPPARTLYIDLGCTNNLTDDVSAVAWRLTVDPGPIVGGEAFGAVFRGVAIVGRNILDASQILVADGYTRSNILDLKATVHVRSGVAPGGMDVVLTPVPKDRTCRYDDNGVSGIGAGPFPQCSQDNDNEDGSNEDCTGLGGVADSANECGAFYDFTTSTDCAPQGLCDGLDQAARDACAANDFCISEATEIAVEGAVEGYVANGSGTVLFGWDDQSTGAQLDETGGPDGVWILPKPVFDDLTGPNGFRSLAGDTEVAFECTMGIGGLPLERTPDLELIAFEIQRR